MDEHLDALEAQLQASGGPWILGAHFTLADVSWVVIFERLLETDSLHVFLDDERRPRVSAYWKAWQERPRNRTRDGSPFPVPRWAITTAPLPSSSGMPPARFGASW